MTGGAGLAPAKRGPGRPKGSVGKRSKDLAGYVSARFGGSAAQQMAAVCMVTPAEVRAAGGVLEARILKARELAEALKVSVAEAWKMLSAELAQLAPYTDQRQPQAIEAKGSGLAPSVVVMGVENAQLFGMSGDQVSRSTSHGEGQDVETLQLLPLAPAD